MKRTTTTEHSVCKWRIESVRRAHNGFPMYHLARNIYRPVYGDNGSCKLEFTRFPMKGLDFAASFQAINLSNLAKWYRICCFTVSRKTEAWPRRQLCQHAECFVVLSISTVKRVDWRQPGLSNALWFWWIQWVKIACCSIIVIIVFFYRLQWKWNN